MIPSAAEALEELEPLIPVIFGALENAVFETQEYFETRKERHDPYLAPCLVRHTTKRFLTTASFQGPTDGPSIRFALEDIANNGLCIMFGRFRIRILKADEGDLPEPTSHARREFYEQLAMPLPTSGGGALSSNSRVNLVVLWDFDRSHDLDGLTLVCPRAGSHDDPSRSYWRLELPHPVESARADPADSDDIDDIDDLDFRIDDDATGTEWNG